MCVSQLYIIVTKIPYENKLEEEKLTLAHGFRGSVYGWPTPPFWAKDEAEHHRGREALLCLRWPGNKESGRRQGQNI